MLDDSDLKPQKHKDRCFVHTSSLVPLKVKTRFSGGGSLSNWNHVQRIMVVCDSYYTAISSFCLFGVQTFWLKAVVSILQDMSCRQTLKQEKRHDSELSIYMSFQNCSNSLLSLSDTAPLLPPSIFFFPHCLPEFSSYWLWISVENTSGLPLWQISELYSAVVLLSVA